MMAHYVQGSVHHDMGEAPQALECYQKAAEQADTTRSDCDFYTLTAIYGQMAVLFHSQYLPTDEMYAIMRSEHFALKDGDTLSAIKAYELRERPYYLQSDTNKVMAIKVEVRNRYIKLGEQEKAARTFRVPISIYLDRCQYEQAQKAMRIFEKESGWFDDSGNIKKGKELYYYDKGRYLLASGKPDSSLFYFTKVLQAGYKEAGYKGLLMYYQKKHIADSIAKYATLFANANDDSYLNINQQRVEQVRASYNYQKHAKEAQRLKEANTLRGWLLCLGLLTLLVLLHRINEELQAKYALLTEDYEQKLEEMKRQQEQATDSEDSQSLSQKMEALSFAIRKANIKKEEIAMNTAHIQESAAFRRLQDDPTIARSDEGIWAEVEAVINEAYPGFTDRLRLLLPKMSGKEWQVSLLLKAQLTHQLIAEIICETQGGESNIRRRLSKKLFPSETPSSSKFDDFIGSL